MHFRKNIIEGVVHIHITVSCKLRIILFIERRGFLDATDPACISTSFVALQIRIVWSFDPETTLPVDKL
jgi:hypothetical protein